MVQTIPLAGCPQGPFLVCTNGEGDDTLKFCHQCGAPIAVGNRFCTSCGTAIHPAEKTSSPAETPDGPLTDTANPPEAQEFRASETEGADPVPPAVQNIVAPLGRSEATQYDDLPTLEQSQAGQPGGHNWPVEHRGPPSWQSYALPAPGAMPGTPASLGDRFLARLIDGGVIIALIIVPALLGSALKYSASLVSNVLALVVLVVLFGYDFVLIAKFGQTVGKRVMKVRVVTVDGAQIPGWGPAAGRTFVRTLIALFTCGLGGLLFDLSPLFDSSPWKRGWNDKVAATVVIAGQSPTWITDSGITG